VKRKLAAHDWEPLQSLASVTRGSIPDFVSPPPSTPLPELNDEITHLLRTPANIVLAELALTYPRGVPRAIRLGFEDPRRFLQNVASIVEKFWRLALEPEWPIIRQRLEGEVLFRARLWLLVDLVTFFEVFTGTYHMRPVASPS